MSMKSAYAVVFLSFSLFACNTPRPGTSEGFISARDANLYYRSAGSGTPVILVHGGPGLDHTYLFPAMDRLARSCRLICYDQRATGRSTGEPDSNRMTIRQYVEDLDSLRSGLGLERVNLIGHSWGALLSMSYALTYPDRVQSMILFSTVGPDASWMAPFFAEVARRRSPEDSAHVMQLMGAQGMAAGDSSAVVAYFREWFRPYFHDPSAYQTLSLNMTAKTARNFVPTWGLFTRDLSSYDLKGSLPQLRVRTLIVHGRSDVMPSSSAESTHKAISGSSLVLLDRCGHFPFLESPDTFFSTIERFIAETQ